MINPRLSGACYSELKPLINNCPGVNIDNGVNERLWVDCTANNNAEGDMSTWDDREGDCDVGEDSVWGSEDIKSEAGIDKSICESTAR